MSWLWEKFKALPTEYKAFSLLVPLILVAAIVAWYSPSPVPPGPDFTQPPAIKGTDVPKEDKPLASGKVRVIPKKKVKDAVKQFPKELEPDEVEVLDTAELPATENGYKVISSINTTTGESKLLTKENSPPLFAFENKKRVGIGYGIGTQGTTAKVLGEWSFLRVGNAHVSVQGEIKATTASSPEATASVLVDYRF